MRKIGEIVGVGSTKSNCKNCKNCVNGLEVLCRNPNPSLLKGRSIGGFGTHIVTEADWAFPIPTNIPLEVAAPLFNSGAVAYNAVSVDFEKLQKQNNRKLRIAIVGLESFGHLSVQFATLLGYEVSVFSDIAEK